MSEMNEWDTQNVIVTGHSDGVVRVSSLSEKATHYPHTEAGLEAFHPLSGWSPETTQHTILAAFSVVGISEEAMHVLPL